MLTTEFHQFLNASFYDEQYCFHTEKKLIVTANALIYTRAIDFSSRC